MSLDAIAQARGVADIVYRQEFSVSYSYPVYFTENLFSADNHVLVDTLCRLEPDRQHRCLFFIDEQLAECTPSIIDSISAYARAHDSSMKLVCDPVLIPGGERVKNDLFYVEYMHKLLFDHKIDRHSYVICIGGGALLDAVGLVTATAHRGIRHIRIPTTVLAQNDSGVGVKNGVNLYKAKNFAGTFTPPFAVLNDISFISTLGDRDKIAGMAEAVKVALIRDAAFFAWLESSSNELALMELPAMAYMIRRCAELHMNQIANGGDPFEMGSARPLDYGHWVAHKLEILTRHHLRHGEAVAIGLALDARYSVLSGLLAAGEEERICVLLEHLGFRLWHPALEQKKDGKAVVLAGLQEFREHLGGELTITLLAGIGTGVEVHDMDESLIEESILWLKHRERD
jgi:3-dehydroquinate synthase